MLAVVVVVVVVDVAAAAGTQLIPLAPLFAFADSSSQFVKQFAKWMIKINVVLVVSNSQANSMLFPMATGN